MTKGVPVALPLPTYFVVVIAQAMEETLNVSE